MADSYSTGTPGTPAQDSRATAFVEARLAGRSIEAYPGLPPVTIEEAYKVQSAAIHQWPDHVAGWKVGRINAPWDGQYGTDRLAGPIFSRQITHGGPVPQEAYVFTGGFGAIEGEIVIEVSEDTPVAKTEWTLSECLEYAGKMRLGVEIASSPFSGINDHGPLVTISDFGNNNGLILGDEIQGWRNGSPAEWKIRTRIEGVEVGAADASSIPGGPLESFRAVLEICARQGLPLRRGMQITTGAVTGVHPIRIGQAATIEMDGVRAISCRVLTAPNTLTQSNPP
jgi:2-keto-4-pentenoate hydratase